MAFQQMMHVLSRISIDDEVRSLCGPTSLPLLLLLWWWWWLLLSCVCGGGGFATAYDHGSNGCKHAVNRGRLSDQSLDPSLFLLNMIRFKHARDGRLSLIVSLLSNTEGGTYKARYRAFSSDDPCGASLDHMEGNPRSTKKFPCRDLRCVWGGVTGEV